MSNENRIMTVEYANDSWVSALLYVYGMQLPRGIDRTLERRVEVSAQRRLQFEE